MTPPSPLAETDWDAIRDELERSESEWTSQLVDFCAIESEDGQAAELERAAEWIRARLEEAKATTRVLRHESSPPLIVGEAGPAASPIVTAVQHYDVQPAGDASLWSSPPYRPTFRDGRLYARGASDNKGELLLRIWAIDAYRRVVGELPCRVRFLVEGEEEVGSPNFAATLTANPELLQAAAALGEGGGIDEDGRPLIMAGNRGMLHVRLTLRILTTDVHSGSATLLPNAAARLAAALATLVDADGAPIWPGMSDGLAPLSRAARESVEKLPQSLLDEMRAEFGVKRLVGGLDGQAAFEADLGRPTCNIQALWSGDVSPTGRNIVPAEASARIDMRLVPNQDPARIRDALREHLDGLGYEDIQIEEIGPSARPYWTDLAHPLVDAAASASEWAFGKPALKMQSAGGTAPMYQVCAPQAVPMVFIGCGDIHGNAHAPDESISVAGARTAALAFLRFLTAVAEVTPA